MNIINHRVLYILILMTLSVSYSTLALKSLKESASSSNTQAPVDTFLENFSTIKSENKKKEKASEDVLDKAYGSIRATILDDIFKNTSTKEKQWYLSQLTQNKELGWKLFNDILMKKTKRGLISKVTNKLNPTDVKELFSKKFIPTIKSQSSTPDLHDSSQLPMDVINYIIGLQEDGIGTRKTKLPLESITEVTITNWQNPEQFKNAYRYALKLALETIQQDLWDVEGIGEGFLKSREKLLDENKKLKKDAIRIKKVSGDAGANTQGLWLVDINSQYLKADEIPAPAGSSWQLKFVIKQHKISQDSSAEEEQAALHLVSSPSSPLKSIPPKILIGRGNDPVTYLPKVSFEEALLQIKRGSQEPQYVTILKAAKGTEIFELSALSNPTNTGIKPFQDYGEALSNFHQYFNIANSKGIPNPTLEDISYTITHGDGHPRNIFYFARATNERGLITFIDNATFALSLQQQPLLAKGYLFQAQPYGIERDGLWRISILDDISKFVYPLVIMFNPNRVFNSNPPTKEDPLLKQVAAFISSYVKAYPKDQQEEIWSLIQKDFDSANPVQEKYVEKQKEAPYTHCGKRQDDINKCKTHLDMVKTLVNEDLQHA